MSRDLWFTRRLLVADEETDSKGKKRRVFKPGGRIQSQRRKNGGQKAGALKEQ